MIRIVGKDALTNRKSSGVSANWAAAGPLQAKLDGVDMLKPGMAGDRVYKDFLELTIHPKFIFSKDTKFFATGSCFARNIELGHL